MRSKYNLFRNLQYHGHQGEQLLEDVGTYECHHVIDLLEMRRQYLGVGSFLWIMDENVIMIQLLRKPALVA